MRRFFFAAVALVSLLLFICVLLAWRGSWIQDKEMPRGYVGGWNYWGYDGFHEPYYVSVSQRGWFMLYRESSREVKRLFSIPYWSAAVVTAIIPAIWFRSLALRHKSKRRAWAGQVSVLRLQLDRNY